MEKIHRAYHKPAYSSGSNFSDVRSLMLSDINKTNLFSRLKRLQGFGFGYALIFCVLDWHAIKLIRNLSDKCRLLCDVLVNTLPYVPHKKTY